MTLKTKMSLSFYTMIALNVVLGAICISFAWSLRSHYASYERQIHFHNYADTLVKNLGKQRDFLHTYMAMIEPDTSFFYQLESKNRRVLTQWKKTVRYPYEEKKRERIEARFRTLLIHCEQVFSLIKKGMGQEAIQTMDHSVLLTIHELRQGLKTVMLSAKKQANQLWFDNKKMAERAITYFFALLGSVMLIGIGLSLLLTQSISRPLIQLEEGVKKIASGDLNLTLDVTEPPELSGLARSFESMARSLKKLQMQIIQMDRMSAVGVLAGGVAHEINNPLTGLLGQTQLLAQDIPSNDPRRPRVEKIERAAQRCKKIVRGLLNFSRTEEYLFEPVDPGEVIQNAFSFFETEMGAQKIRVEWKKTPGLPKLWASPNHIQQVFKEILINAMQAMPQGGTLTITLGIGEDSMTSGPGKQNHPQASGTVLVCFNDTGTGISPEHIQHVFDPFFTTREPGKGTGLGLSISYQIIQKHHGTIEAISGGAGKGASLKVQIPCSRTA